MINTTRSPSRARDKLNNEEASLSSNAAFLSANRAYQPRPSSIRSVSTSSVASNSVIRAGSRTPETGIASNEDTPSTLGTRTSLDLPQPQRMPSLSPSHTAALIAAARAGQARSEDVTPSKRPVISTRSRPTVAARPREFYDHSSSNITINNTPNDISPIAPTTSLVSLFERKSSNASSKRQLGSERPPKSSAKPYRPDNGISSVFQMEVGSGLRSSQGVQSSARSQETKVGVLAQIEGPIGGEQYHGATKDGQGRDYTSSSHVDDDDGHSTTRGRQQKGGQIHQIRDAIETHDFADSGRARAEDHSFRASTKDRTNLISPPPTIRSQTAKPTIPSLPPPVARTTTAPINIRPRPRPLSTYSNSAQSTQSLSATYRQLYPKKTTPLTTDDELANAIVASSLASSRMSSPHGRAAPPVPASRRHSRHIFHSRTPSPVKSGLRQTLRKQDSSDSDEEDSKHPYGKHQKKRLIRKHPNKHHEGDRKRWRDAVTEDERRRYEGVWAANKGLCLASTSSRDTDVTNEHVCNVVVKDIWTRSRLPEFELEAVWNLVDNDGMGRLTKEEFVVGMWLIDQRLKGRKLPVKVQPTVWASVRGIKGIKIRNKR